MPSRPRRTSLAKPSSERSRSAVAPAALAVLLVAGLAACGEDEATPTAADGSGSPDSSETSSAPTTQSVEPSASVETSTPTATDSGRSKALLARLLEPEMVGKMNAEWLWRTSSTSNDDPEDLATCHRFSLSAIGAEEVALRRFDSPSGEGTVATEAVAKFADLETARRAYSVLRAWHDSCQSRLDKADGGAHKVNDLERVSRAGNRASWYLLTGPGSDPDTSTIEAVGYTLRDNHVATVVMRSEGQDYNYESGQEPVPVSLRAAAALLG